MRNVCRVSFSLMALYTSVNLHQRESTQKTRSSYVLYTEYPQVKYRLISLTAIESLDTRHG